MPLPCSISECRKPTHAKSYCQDHYQRFKKYGRLNKLPLKIVQGDRFGRLIAVRLNRRDSYSRAYWLCKCDCGDEREVRHDALTRGQDSCGCRALESLAARAFKHGKCVAGRPNGNRTYVSWNSMRQRCYDPNHHNYKHYGAQGITVCARWRDSFINFLADMEERPEGMTLDRIDPYGNYDPSNCRWADAKTQNNNKRKHKRAA